MPIREAKWYGEVVTWLDQTLDELARQPAIGYMAGGSVAAEPTAIAALALAAPGRLDAAKKAADALASMQESSGEVAVRPAEQWPGWPTSLAVIAWNAIDRMAFRANSDRAIDWLLAHRG